MTNQLIIAILRKWYEQEREAQAFFEEEPLCKADEKYHKGRADGLFAALDLLEVAAKLEAVGD